MPVPRTNALGEWLKSRRLALDLTQAELARRVGCATVTLHKIETGARRPSRQVAELLAEALEIVPHERAAFVRFARDGHVIENPLFMLPPTPKPREPGNYPLAQNFPTTLPPLIGREIELAQLRALFAKKRTRLVTLTGMGGIGKTRLANQFAQDWSTHMADGAWFVDLSALRDATLAPPAILRALDLRDSSTRAPQERLESFLRDKQLLLVLDNLEQLTEVAPLVERLLTKCRRLQILVTSRSPLHLPGEHNIAVMPLALPPPHSGNAASVALFIQHARSIKPDLTISESQLDTVGEICRTLEGIPLALELGAARAKLLPLKQIAELLQHRFHLLRGNTAAPARHETLWNALEWSYDLLSTSEREVLRRLSAFSGSCSLNAAELVCATSHVQPHDVLDLLGSLADKSLLLVRQTHDAARFSMLETIREFAEQKLVEAAKVEETHDRHLVWLLELTTEARRHFLDAEQNIWLDRLELEYDNVRVALDRCLSAGKINAGMKLAGEVWRFWVIRGYWREALAAIAALLKASGTFPASCERNKLLHMAGYIAWVLNDDLGAQKRYGECIAAAESIGDEINIAYAERGLGLLEYGKGSYAPAERYFENALGRFRGSGDVLGTIMARDGLAELARVQHDYETAEALYLENLALAQQLGYVGGIAVQSHNLGHVVLARGDTALSFKHLRLALELDSSLGDKRKMAEDIAGLACVEIASGNLERGVKWGAAVDHTLQRLGTRLDPTDGRDLARYLELARASLDHNAFELAWTNGQAQTLETLVADVLALLPADARPAHHPLYPPLTPP